MAALYANPDSALERAVNALKFQFRQIDTGNGYRNTVGDILTEIPDASANLNYPALVLIRGRAEVLSTDVSFVNKRIPFTLMAYIRDNTDPTAARLSLLQDVERLLGNEWAVKGEDGVETCRFAGLEGDQPFGMLMNKPMVGFVMGFSILVSQYVLDPSVAA